MATEEPKSDEAQNNPYFSTYLRNHKEINLPEHFGETPESKQSSSGSSETAININVNRTDYKTLSKVKLFTIKNILSRSECDTLIKLTNDIGYVPIAFEYPEDYRKCERVVCKSFELASIIWNKIIPYFTRHDIENIRPYGFGNQGIWRPTHINEAVRFTRYRDGDFFKPHRDGGYTRSNLNRSVYTLMIYLNDANSGGFQGGETVFYSLPRDKSKDSGNPQNEDLFLNDDDMKDAVTVSIEPEAGMCVIFNHDVWHQGKLVHGNKDANSFKHILRSDVMFECYDCETFNRDKLIHDPLYMKAQKYYKLTIDLQNEGKVRESTISYLKALSIQTTLPSVVVDKDDNYYGAEFQWFHNDVYEYIFSFLDVYRLVTACYVSRAWYFYATSPNLWKNAYMKYFDVNELAWTRGEMHGDEKHVQEQSQYHALFRPWKHIFSYRVMVKNEFPMIVLNFWFNGIEIGSTSKRKKKQKKTATDSTAAASKYNNNDQELMNENAAQYIPFATGEYLESNYWSWKPYRKEILYGRIVYAAGSGYGRWGFQPPRWCIDEHGVLDGLRFHKLLKQILYFPNIVVSLPAIMYDNKLFMLYLKYSFTKFNSEKFSKVFALCVKNMEEEIAKFYKCSDCVIVLNEHRSFSVSVIQNGKRVLGDSRLMKKFIATKQKTDGQQKSQYFPNEYFHYRDDYDSSFYIANVSNFDFVSSVAQQQHVAKLVENASEMTQRMEAMPDLEPYRWSTNRFRFINESTTAPTAVLSSKQQPEQPYYYDIAQRSKEEEKDEKELLQKLRVKLGDEKCADLETTGSVEVLKGLVNDMYVGPDKGQDIPQNDDFKYLTDRWNQRVDTRTTDTRDHEYYAKNRAPFHEALCYSAFDLILALKQVLSECDRQSVFTQKDNEDDEQGQGDGERKEIPVIMVGPLSRFYGDFVAEFCGLCNDEEMFEQFTWKPFVNEYVQNEGTVHVKDRSSALQQLLQSVVTPQEISHFKSISDIKAEIIEYQPQPEKKEEKAAKVQKQEKQTDAVFPPVPAFVKTADSASSTGKTSEKTDKPVAETETKKKKKKSWFSGFGRKK